METEDAVVNETQADKYFNMHRMISVVQHTWHSLLY